MFKGWGLVGGVVAALAAGVYVLWGPISDKKKMRKGLVPGLLNVGNSCFLNALLQGLASCPSFIKWLQELSGLRQRAGHLSTTLLELLKALSSYSPAEEDVLDAGCLLDVLRLQRWHISLFEEQDAHELFHVLTSSLEEEQGRQATVIHLFDMQSLESSSESGESSLSCRVPGPLHSIPKLKRNQHPFHGRLMSCMVCKGCRQQSPVRYDSFDSLSLTIPPAQWGQPITLEQCLQHFISSETVSEVECVNCTKMQAVEFPNGHIGENHRSTFIKQLKLGKLPQCLCIHLQRLTWSSEGRPMKRHEHVQFKEYLSMDSYKHSFFGSSQQQKNCTSQSVHSQSSGVDYSNVMPASTGHFPSALPSSFSHPLSSAHNHRCLKYFFRLTAVVVHHGDMHSGHFITYRRSPASPHSSAPLSSQWLWVSDDTVRKASLQEALSSTAYLLFYERVQRSPTAHTEGSGEPVHTPPPSHPNHSTVGHEQHPTDDTEECGLDHKPTLPIEESGMTNEGQSSSH
ncbi:ubiquitin carboxyl-terminal hydrolase 30 isoform X2 [Engraulis encrasicolus]|uniref:ubiquitin carboxyl-terminal hydrolase 30 isoform X2 n=1 Tax=Engraulis encrasicolus TaxID=184585 RepID=UPI002FCEE60E